MADPRHSEVEIKLAADAVDPAQFNRWATGMGPDRFEHVIGPDVYYIQGQSVLRHRLSGGPGELTVKKRKDKSSTMDRLEIDLKIDASQNVNDVTAFLLATGWRRLFTVVKEAWIFWYPGEEGDPPCNMCIYDVSLLTNGKHTGRRRFIEVEIDKEHGGKSSDKAFLDHWEQTLRTNIPGLGKIQTKSLYEIYSGRRYGMVKT